MPSRWLRRGPNKLKKCSERRTNSCSDETDGCCGVIACTYCLRFAAYSGTQYGTAEFSGTGWSGSIAGAEFFGYWERNYDGECEFIVELDGNEIYRKGCYEGQSCRDSSDSAEASIGYETGTLYWTKFEPRPLPVVSNRHFCGDCHCSCKCLCVTITEPDGITIHKGEICDQTYGDCGAPEWGGSVGGRAISLTLDRDEYGDCIIGGSIGYDDAEWTVLPSCQGWSVSFSLPDYTTVFVRCKECDCESDGPELTCCGPDRCLPPQDCSSPLPSTLRINVSGTFSGGACTCLALDSTLTFYATGAANIHNGLPNVWAGTFTNCGVMYRYSLGCASDEAGWRLVFQQGDSAGGSPTNCLASSVLQPDGIPMEKASCSPLVLSGVQITSGIGCCNGSHLVGLATLDIVIWE